ncbi:MAG: IgGFc-binding protein, partial [Fibrobacterales bacterium]
KPFFVNVLHRTANHGEVITSKGSAAPGKEFYSGHMHSTFSNPGDNHAKVKSHFISFMATQEGTTTVTVTNNTLRFYGQTENTFKVTLNKGESYIVGNSLRSIENECGLDDNCINGYNGTHITSTKEIVVNSGTYLGGYDGTTWRDIGIDQLVPVEKTGMEYILMQGNGSSAAASMEVVIAVATFANTSLTVNGSDTYSLSKPGDYAIIPIDKYINKNMYIQSTKNIYAYQT